MSSKSNREDGQILPFIPGEMDAARLLSRLRSSDIVELVAAEDKSRYFQPPSPDYTPKSGGTLPLYDYMADIHIAPRTDAFNPDDMGKLNDYLTKLLGKPTSERRLALMPFDDVSEDLVYKRAVGDPRFNEGDTPLISRVDTMLSIIRSELAGQLVIIPGSLRYERRIGTMIRKQEYDFDFPGVGQHGILRKEPEISKFSVKGAIDIHVYPSLKIAKEASRDTTSFLRSQIISIVQG